MRTTFTTSKSAPAKVDAVVVPVAASGAVPSGLGHTRAQLSALGFDGAAGQTLALPGSGSAKATLLVGIGEVKDLTPNSLRNIAASAARAASRFASLSTTLASVGRGSAKANTQAVVEGMALALHRWVDLKNDKGGLPKLTSITFVAATGTAEVKAGMDNGIATASAVCLARDLANTPPSHLTTRQLADRAVEVARTSGLKATVYNRDQLIAMGCGGLVGVNAGSVEPPRMVKLEYRPTKASGNIVLVGKGVMYDSGGISLKPSDPSHASMKMDMSGAAAVLATMGALRSLKVKAKVTAYLMCTDNLPSGSALKLGDVLTMRNGKTVEIHNTDAEGRLILADGLSLGMAVILGNNDGVLTQWKAASSRTDELVWELPFHRPYRALLDSNVADMRNIGGPLAGATTAALFLGEFVGETPWAHIDMAGPMDADGDNGWLNRGATAYGTRLLIDFCANFKKPAGKNK